MDFCFWGSFVSSCEAFIQSLLLVVFFKDRQHVEARRIQAKRISKMGRKSMATMLRTSSASNYEAAGLSLSARSQASDASHSQVGRDASHSQVSDASGSVGRDANGSQGSESVTVSF